MPVLERKGNGRRWSSSQNGGEKTQYRKNEEKNEFQNVRKRNVRESRFSDERENGKRAREKAKSRLGPEKIVVERGNEEVVECE